MSDDKKENKDSAEKTEIPAPKKETAMNKKVLDKTGRDWSKPKSFKKEGEV
jgi:hypothetical protein